MESAVNGFHHVLCTEIDGVSLYRRKDQHGRPRPPIFPFRNLGREIGQRPWRNVLALHRATIETADRPVYSAHVENVRIFAIGRDVAAFTTADSKPVATVNLAMIRSVDRCGISAILLRAVDVIRKIVVRDYVIKLRSWLVVPRAPRRAAVESDRRALISSKHHL